MKNYFLVIGVLIVFGLSGCGGVTTVPSVSTLPNEPTTNILSEVIQISTSTQVRPPFSLDLKNETFQYVNSKYKFSLEYPKSWDVVQTENASSTYGPFFVDGYSFSLTDISTLRPNADIPKLDIAVTEKSFQDIVKMIEDIDRLPNGDTASAVGDIEDVIINNIAAKKGSNGTGIGLPESFYFIPLQNQNKSLWITYYSFETSTIDAVQKIVSSLKLN